MLKIAYLDAFDFLAPPALVETRYKLNQQTLMFFEPGEIVRMTVARDAQAGTVRSAHVSQGT